MQVLVPRGELGWDAIVHLYDEDRVVEAFEAAKVAGLGPTASMAQWYRTLEAEAITRERAASNPACFMQFSTLRPHSYTNPQSRR